MVKNIRSAFLLFAGLTIILSSISGCAGGGRGLQLGNDGTPLEVSFPSAEYLDRLPTETPVRIQLLSGSIVEGFHISYNPETTSMMFRMEQVDASLSTEFNEEGRTYRIPLEKIVTLKILDAPDDSKVTGVIVGVAVVVVGAFLVWANYAFSAIGN